MSNTLTGIALFAIIAVLIAYLISRSKSVDRVIRTAEQRQDDTQAARDEAACLRMIYEAACELSEKPAPTSDEQARSRATLRQAVAEADSKPVSMEPFCGEGKKQ